MLIINKENFTPEIHCSKDQLKYSIYMHITDIMIHFWKTFTRKNCLAYFFVKLEPGKRSLAVSSIDFFSL